MLIETKRLLITEFSMDMAQVVRDNSLDEDNKRFVPDEVWETKEETEETLKYLISQYGTVDGPLVYPIIVKKTKENLQDYLISYVKEHREVNINTIMPNESNIKAVLKVI